MSNTQFPVDDVIEIVKSVIKDVVQIRDESIASVIDDWATNIEEKVLFNLSKLNRPLKYIVTCIITQNIGGYLYSATSNYWDNTTDDESKFNIFGSDGRIIVWRTKDEELNPKNLVGTVKHGGGGVLVWGYMSASGQGTCTVRWENHFMNCAVTVFGLSI